MNVQSTEVKKRPLTKTVRVAGTIEENATGHRVLSASIPGRIDDLHVNFIGAEVAAGQPLADFYSPTLLQAEREYRSLAGELREKTAVRLRQMGLTPEQIAALPGQKRRRSHLANPRAGGWHGHRTICLRRPIRAGRRKAVRAGGLRDDVVYLPRLRAGPAVDQGRPRG